MKDFFISYTQADVKFALWVAELLERNGHSTEIQAWDFRPGDSFVSKINSALIKCKKLIVILSKNYMKSKWGEVEWTAKFAEQIKLNKRRLIPIRIESFELDGMLSSVVYIDIVDKTEDDAEKLILDGIKDEVVRKSEGYPSFYSVEHQEIDVDYCVENSCITYYKTCRSTVLVPGTKRLHNRLTWFPDEEITISSLTDGVEIEPLNLRDTFYNFNVVFDHTIEKNEEVNFRIKAVLSNKNHHFSNCFSTEIITPIKHLAIHLSILDEVVTKVYTQKISNSYMNKRTEQPEEHSFKSPFTWNITDPEMHYEYKIYW